MSKIEVNEIDKQNGSTVTIGGSGTNGVLGTSGQTVSLGTGASQTGFGRTGTVNWQTAIKTATFTAVSGEGYFCNTTAGSFTVNLPSSPSVGDIVSVKDYARTFDTDPLTIGRNGSPMDGNAADTNFSTEGLSATLIYMDATKGWSLINDDATGETGAAFVTATGGSIANSPCGNFKVHTFTGPGSFAVSCAGNANGSNTVSYMIVAGGGGGGTGCSHGAGGGAGGFRESRASGDSYSASPLNATSGPTFNIPVSVQSYAVVVGGGGAGAQDSSPKFGADGTVSSVFGISSAGGGAGGGWNNSAGRNGGSGSGSACNPSPASVGSGNTPPVSPPQGNNGGNSSGSRMGGGGGAGEAGNTDGQGHGGDGVISEITGSPIARAGGGSAGGSSPSSPIAGGDGGGGIGAGPGTSTGGAGTDNTGGGGGGSFNSCEVAGNGGSGVVIIRYKFQ